MRNGGDSLTLLSRLEDWIKSLITVEVVNGSDVNVLNTRRNLTDVDIRKIPQYKYTCSVCAGAEGYNEFTPRSGSIMIIRTAGGSNDSRAFYTWGEIWQGDVRLFVMPQFPQRGTGQYGEPIYYAKEPIVLRYGQQLRIYVTAVALAGDVISAYIMYDEVLI